MFRRLFWLGVPLAFLSLAAPSASAQQASSLELFGGLSVSIGRLDSLLTTSYPPVLRSFTSTGLAGQTFELRAGSATGFELGANLFPSAHLGVQLLVGRERFDLSGPSSLYAIHLEYVARFPPSYAPTPVTIDRSEPWPEASGEITQLTLSFNGVGRWALGPRVNAEVSGGLSHFRMSGRLQPVAYSTFQLGGHSVLFSDLYELALDAEGTSSLGFNAGGGIDVRLGPHVSLAADFRYFDGRVMSAPMAVAEIVNFSEVVSPEPLDSIQLTLQPPPLELSPRRARVMVGLKALF